VVSGFCGGGGQRAARAAPAFLASGRVRDLKLARKLFIWEHGTVFRVLRSRQDACCNSDERRGRFVSLCHDRDVQKPAFAVYMNKKLVAARPMAHIRIGFRNVAHLLGLVKPSYV